MTCQGPFLVYGLGTVLKINLWSQTNRKWLGSTGLWGASLWHWKWQNTLVPSSSVTCRVTRGGWPQGPAGRILDTIHYGERARTTNVGLLIPSLLPLAVLAGQGSDRPTKCYLAKIGAIPEVSPSRQNTDVRASGLSFGVLLYPPGTPSPPLSQFCLRTVTCHTP